MDGLNRFDPTIDVCAAGVLVSGTAHLWRPSVGWGRRDLVFPQSVHPQAACHLLVHLPPRVLGCPSPRGAAAHPGLTWLRPVSPRHAACASPSGRPQCVTVVLRAQFCPVPGGSAGAPFCRRPVTGCDGGPVAPVEGPWVGSCRPLLLPSPPAWRRGRAYGDAGRPATAP